MILYSKINSKHYRPTYQHINRTRLITMRSQPNCFEIVLFCVVVVVVVVVDVAFVVVVVPHVDVVV